jgi:hypothetical protein
VVDLNKGRARKRQDPARVRVAVLNHGLAEKVFRLDECVDPEEGEWVEVETDDDPA